MLEATMNVTRKVLFFGLILTAVVLPAKAEFYVSELAGAGDVLTDGTLVTAVNCGYAAANGDVTVNGLAFTAGGTETEGGTDNYSQVGGAGLRALGWGVGTIFTGDAGTTDAFNHLFNSIAWQAGTVVTDNTLTLHLNDLAVGEDYRLQLFYGESRPTQGAHRFDVTVQGGTSDIYSVGVSDRGGMSPAIRVDCYFTATASDVDVVLTAQPEGLATSGVSFSAYALHAGVVPEPATMVLLGLGSLVLRKRRN